MKLTTAQDTDDVPAAPATPESAPSRPSGTSTAQVSQANLQFAVDLYKLMAGKSGQNSSDNIFFSAWGIMAGLGMTLAGAEEKTAAEIVQSLHLEGISTRDVHLVLGQFAEELSQYNKSIAIRQASKLYFERNLSVLSPYMDTLLRVYHAPIGRIDFTKNPQRARPEINKWVESQTMDKVRNLLSAGSVSRNTRMVLVNAMCFKGLWARPFHLAHSFNSWFFLRSNDKHPRKVTFMRQRGKMNYKADADLKCTAVEVPLKSQELKMLLLLPNDFDGLKSLEERLSAERLKKLLASLKEVDIEVRIPRFQVDSPIHLDQFLPDLGMKELFSSTAANLSAMCTSSLRSPDRVFLNKAVHKSVIDISEVGIAASSINTVVEREHLIENVEPNENECKKWNGNHPFVLLIYNRKQEVYFVGRVVKPKSAA